MNTETAKRPCRDCGELDRHTQRCSLNNPGIGVLTQSRRGVLRVAPYLSPVLDSEREREDALPPGMSTGYENMDDDLDPKEPQ